MKYCSLLIMTGVVALTGCAGTGDVTVESHVSEETMAMMTASASSALELEGGLLVVDGARIAVSEIEIECCEEGDEEREAELGAAVIDVNVDGQPTMVTMGSVESGEYTTIGFELNSRTATIAVDGVYDGEPFTYTTLWKPELEFALDPPVDVPENGQATVGVTFDVAAWFLRADGTAIDPTDSSNHAAIEQRIVAAMTAQAIEVELEGQDND